MPQSQSHTAADIKGSNPLMASAFISVPGAVSNVLLVEIEFCWFYIEIFRGWRPLLSGISAILGLICKNILLSS